MNKPKVVLASASKRRSEILSSCGIKHSVIASNAREIHPGLKTIKRDLISNAESKVRAVMHGLTGQGEVFVIAADTLVVAGGSVIGKPRDAAHAKKILKKLSGSRALVYTGVTVYRKKLARFASSVEKSEIKVSLIPPQDIDKYFSKLGPFDKAGGFSIEGVGSIIFDDIKGSYFNILGLPMRALEKLFKLLGADILDLT